MGLGRIILLLLLVPLLDAIVLVFVAAAYLGAVPTVALVVLTALVGMLLVRAEGRRTVRKIQRQLRQGEPPTDELIDGGLLIAAGAFLLTPGLVTDAIGFLIAIPVTRVPIRLAVKRWVIVPYADEKTGGFATGNVYVGGFPGEDDFEGGFPGAGRGGPGPGPGGGSGPATDDEDVIDIGDARDVDVEDTDDSRS